MFICQKLKLSYDEVKFSFFQKLVKVIQDRQSHSLPFRTNVVEQYELHMREKSKVQFSFGFIGENLGSYDFHGQEQDTLEDTPDLKDEDLLEEQFNFPQRQAEICQQKDITDTKPDEIFVVSNDYVTATEDIEDLTDDKAEDEKPFMLYRYLVEDRRDSGSVTLLRMASLPSSELEEKIQRRGRNLKEPKHSITIRRY